jgi:hypothetical protein
MYILPELIIQETLPGRIQRPGSVSLRHLGEGCKLRSGWLGVAEVPLKPDGAKYCQHNETSRD